MFRRHIGGIYVLIVLLLRNGSDGSSVLYSSSPIQDQLHDDNEGSTHLQLPTFWDSHMVLQREPAVSNIWGWAAPGANVSVTLDRGTITRSDITTVAFSIASNVTGIWSVDIPPQRAGSGYALHITDGSQSIVLEDVAFGDVYLCSGQSNMQMSVPATFNATSEVRRRDRKRGFVY
jgi:sialate O-acetylesterase